MMDASGLRVLDTGASGAFGGGSLTLASTGIEFEPGLGNEWVPERRNKSCVAVASLARAPAKLGRLSRADESSGGRNGPS
jgi:hypothetical protein